MPGGASGASVLGSFRGESAALAAAGLWAMAAMLYSRAGRVIPPLEMNLIKGILATILLGLTLLVVGDTLGGSAPQALAWLLISGALGIGLGDTAYFASLVRLGPRRALLLGILAPPLTGLIALAFMGEALSWGGWLGIGLTVLGVAWVITERSGNGGGDRRAVLPGVGFALLAAVCQAAGAVMSHAALAGSSISALWSAFLRLAAGLATLVAMTGWMALRRLPVGGWLRSAGQRRVWRPLLPAILLGTYLGIWLSQVSFKFAAAGVAQALLSTSPLFVLPLAALAGDKVTARALLGVLIALAGIALLFGLG